MANNARLSPSQLAALVRKFLRGAQGAVRRAQVAEMFEAAYEYARFHACVSDEMTAILAHLVQQRRVPTALLDTWRRDGASALGEVAGDASYPCVPEGPAYCCSAGTRTASPGGIP